MTACFVPRIKSLGHEAALFVNHGLKGSPLEWGGMMMYPGAMDPWGNDVMTAYALHHFRGDRNAGWVVLLQDVWTLKSQALKDLHVAAWSPIDHTPAPPRVIEFFTRTGAVPIAMSRHGERMYEEAGLRPMYVPHGIDTNLFRPHPKKDDIREALGVPKDAFCFGMVAANNGVTPSRKAYPEALQAFARFQTKHSSAVLYLHTMKTKMHTGLDLPRLAKACGIPESAIVYVDQFSYTLGELATTDMPPIYSAMDVLLNPSYGEGFGMPIIEAQSCGVPVVLADNTAMTELCGSGWLVPCYPEWDEHQLSWWGKVRVEDLVVAMEKAYHVTDRHKREAREFVVANYDAEDIMSRYWKPALDELEEMLKVPKAEPVDMEKVQASL